MKEFSISTTDNFKNADGYAKILSLSNEYSNFAFAVNNYVAILDLYYCGAYSSYGEYFKFALVWQSVNNLKINLLTPDYNKIIPENLFAVVYNQYGLDLYVKSNHNNVSLSNKMKVLSFSNSGKWFDGSSFEDISNLAPKYPTINTVYNSSFTNSEFLNTKIDKNIKDITFSSGTSLDIDVSLLGAMASGFYHGQIRTYDNSNKKFLGIDFVCNNGTITTKEPFEVDKALNITANTDENTFTVSNLNTNSFVYFDITRN